MSNKQRRDKYWHYVYEWFAHGFKNGWEQLEWYNKNDVEIMIPAINTLIQYAFEQHIDMLKSYSLASVAIAMRYSSLYRTFDTNQDYIIPTRSLNHSTSQGTNSVVCARVT